MEITPAPSAVTRCAVGKTVNERVAASVLLFVSFRIFLVFICFFFVLICGGIAKSTFDAVIDYAEINIRDRSLVDACSCCSRMDRSFGSMRKRIRRARTCVFEFVYFVAAGLNRPAIGRSDRGTLNGPSPNTKPTELFRRAR